LILPGSGDAVPSLPGPARTKPGPLTKRYKLQPSYQLIRTIALAGDLEMSAGRASGLLGAAGLSGHGAEGNLEKNSWVTGGPAVAVTSRKRRRRGLVAIRSWVAPIIYFVSSTCQL